MLLVTVESASLREGTRSAVIVIHNSGNEKSEQSMERPGLPRMGGQAMQWLSEPCPSRRLATCSFHKSNSQQRTETKLKLSDITTNY